MNREEKLNFIESNHPELYKLLEANVYDYVSDAYHASTNDINLYNSWVSFYCGQINDPQLMHQLLV